ncbi:ABC transporter substrate-binding protein [Leucobacter sp. wl10]|uniref:ABC transporter substrate-binding protein n=1 Tax=Leucobacter sp. wl10 TaxID=2304677 RepID=UPI000E5A8025|nr:ABC transporter substrate-binding protein [Leucobacter sp. wl10]RGE22056.1 hypothetical protein D1J51_06095 [Leucobacter sp. wl10]
MKLKNRLIAGGAVAIAAMLVLVGCSGGSSGAGAGGTGRDTIRVAIDADGGCLDPGTLDMRVTLQWSRQMADSLVYMGPDGVPRPWLATEFEVNKDATEYTFKLRDDVTFTDGSKLDAETVKANFDRLFELGADAWAAQAHLAGYETTEVVDKSTVKVRFSEPNVAFLYGVSTPQLAIYSKESVALKPAERCVVGGLQGSGPYVVTEYVPMERLTLKRNDDYAWGAEGWDNQGPGKIKTLQFNIMDNDSTRSGAALSGEIDVVHTVTEADAGLLKNAGFQNSPKPLPAISASWKINLGSPIMSDQAVRKALMIGFDRKEMLATKPNIFSPATGVENSSHPFRIDLSDQLAYDLDAASKILDDAGWKMGANGVREKDGKPLDIEVIVYTPGADTNMENVQQQLKKLGVNLSIYKTDSNGLRERWQGLDYDMLIDWNTSADAGNLESFFAYTNAPAEIDEANTAQLGMANRDERIKFVQDFQKQIIENAWMIPLWEENTTPFWSSDVTKMTFDVAGVALYSNVEIQ